MLENFRPDNPLKFRSPLDTDPKKMDTSEYPRFTKPKGCKCCGNEELKEKGEKDGYAFWECSECAYVFTGLQDEKMVKPYESVKHAIQSGATKNGRDKSIEFLSPALSWLPDHQLKIMDFGCGECNIPHRLRKEGHRVIAVDIVPPLNHHPDRLTGDIMDLDIPANSFDLIYSYQVFEHIAEPRHVLKRLCRLLKPDGMILIHTDMETSDRYSCDFENWWYVLPPDHCSYFRHKTFENMFEEFGCRVIYKNSKVVLAIKD